MGREHDDEVRPTAGSVAEGVDGPAVGFNDRLGDRQADAGAAAVAVASGVCPVEAFKHVAQVRGVDPFAGVADYDLGVADHLSCGDRDRALGRSVP